MREDVRNGRLSPDQAVETLKNDGCHSQFMMDWLVGTGRRRYERGVEEKVQAEEAARRALQEGRGRRAEEK